MPHLLESGNDENFQVKISQKLSGHQEQTFHWLCAIRKSLVWSHASRVTSEALRVSHDTRARHWHARPTYINNTPHFLQTEPLNLDSSLNSWFMLLHSSRGPDVKLRKGFSIPESLPRMHLHSNTCKLLVWQLCFQTDSLINYFFYAIDVLKYKEIAQTTSTISRHVTRTSHCKIWWCDRVEPKLLAASWSIMTLQWKPNEFWWVVMVVYELVSLWKSRLALTIGQVLPCRFVSLIQILSCLTNVADSHPCSCTFWRV